jgi:hypothetical protein
VDEPGIEIDLQRLDGLVEGLAHLHPEELVEDGAVEALDEARWSWGFGPWCDGG